MMGIGELSGRENISAIREMLEYRGNGKHKESVRFKPNARDMGNDRHRGNALHWS